MDSKTPLSGKRSGRRRKKSKIRRDRKRDRKTKSTPYEETCEPGGNSADDMFSTVVSVHRPSEQGNNKLTKQSGPSQQSASPSKGQIRPGESGEDFSQTCRTETERLTDLITAIFDAAAAVEECDRVPAVAVISGGSVDHSRFISPEDSDELLELTDKFNESLRWRDSCSSPEEEERRLRKYKLNRRKRYLVESLQNRQDKEVVLAFAKELANNNDDTLH